MLGKHLSHLALEQRLESLTQRVEALERILVHAEIQVLIKHEQAQPSAIEVEARALEHFYDAL